MNIPSIVTNQDYEHALQRIDKLMDARRNTEEGAELDALVTCVERYEDAHFPIVAPDPVEAILFRMDQMGLER